MIGSRKQQRNKTIDLSRPLFQGLAAFLLFGLGAFAQTIPGCTAGLICPSFQTYLGTAGAFPSLTGASAVLQVRAYHPIDPTKITSLQLWLKTSAGAQVPDFNVRIDPVNKTIFMVDSWNSTSVGTWPGLPLILGTQTVSPAYGFADLQLTQYRYAFVGHELQIDLYLTRSAKFTGVEQVTLGANDAAPNYSSPWVWTSVGQWDNEPGPKITNFAVTTTPVNYTPVFGGTASPCSLTPTSTYTSTGAAVPIGANAIPVGPYCATVTVSGFAAPLAAGSVTVSVNNRNAPVLSVDPTGTQVSVAGAGVAGWDGSNVNVVVSAGTQKSSAYPVAVGIAGANPVSNPNACAATAIPLCWAAASRFLEQAAFGPSHNDVVRLQAMGIDAWLKDQFQKPVATPYNFLDPNLGGFEVEGRFFYNAANLPDQLRKKVAFALSQLFVVSAIKDGETQSRVMNFFNLLDQDAFTNYATLLRDVTLSPQMGYYLDMAGNSVANGASPSENYAREILQLFSIGTQMLNMSGQPIDGNGNVVTASNGLTAKATYHHIPEIASFARVFTGWEELPNAPYPQGFWDASSMVLNPDPTSHDTGSKTLLTVPGVTLANSTIPAGGTPQSDLAAALANIESHPNVAPFISKFLIQHLVTSNPSPAYVQRVASQFAQSKGDMQTVLRAILKDTEARAGDTVTDGNPAFGHLQEPAQWLTALSRAIGVTVGDYTNQLFIDSTPAGQEIFSPPTVFNFYSPSFTVPAVYLSLAAGAQPPLGPEFQLQSPATAYQRLFTMAGQLSGSDAQVAGDSTWGITDLGLWSNLANSAGDYDLLIDALDANMTHGTMPAAFHAAIKSALPLPGQFNPLVGYGTDRYLTAKFAIYLLSTSSYYQVSH